MLTKPLTVLFERDLGKLKQEISAYTNEKDLWVIQDGILNSSGNLCLHLVGNLKHFIGKILGGNAYERVREKEFSDKNIPSAELMSSVDETTAIVSQTLNRLSEDDLSKIYPVNVFGNEMTTESFILSLYGHLNYHLGQINYHRRLLDV